MIFHPKTSGAAVGGALGTLIVSVLGSIHGVNLSDAANAAIPAFLAALGAWFVPAPDSPPDPAPAAPPVPTVWVWPAPASGTSQVPTTTPAPVPVASLTYPPCAAPNATPAQPVNS